MNVAASLGSRAFSEDYPIAEAHTKPATGQPPARFLAPEPISEPVLVSDDAAILDQIRGTDIALVHRTRALPGTLRDALDRLDLDQVDDVEIKVDVPVARTALEANLVVSGYGGLLASALSSDIADLADRFAAITDTSRLAIRLNVVETNSCCRFHADYVSYRLISTYRGRGTEYVRTRGSAATERMQAGDIGIFKGALLLDAPTVLHRSPPIEATGEQRLLLVIEAAAEHPELILDADLRAARPEIMEQT